VNFCERTYLNILEDGNNWSADFNVSISILKSNYKKFIDKKFKNHRKKKFSELVKFRYAQELAIGDLAYIPSPTSDIRIFIVEEKMQSRSNYNVLELLDDLISAEYLLWFLSRPPVMDYLKIHAVGAVYTYIPKHAFDTLVIPYPKGQKNKAIKSLTISQSHSSFRILLRQYYSQYQYNYEKGNFMSAAILAGAVAETFMHNYLIEVGLSKNSLNGKGLGGMIHLAEAFHINSEIKDFPISQFFAVQKLRNEAVHPALAKDRIENDREEIGIHHFNEFNQLVKYFGL